MTELLLLLQVICAVVIFFIINYCVWYITEKNRMIPEWLDYQPFNCRKCATFWLGESIFITVGIIFHLWLFMAVGAFITGLNAIAMHVDEQNAREIAYNLIESYGGKIEVQGFQEKNVEE